MVEPVNYFNSKEELNEEDLVHAQELLSIKYNEYEITKIYQIFPRIKNSTARKAMFHSYAKNETRKK